MKNLSCLCIVSYDSYSNVNLFCFMYSFFVYVALPCMCSWDESNIFMNSRSASRQSIIILRFILHFSNSCGVENILLYTPENKNVVFFFFIIERGCNIGMKISVIKYRASNLLCHFLVPIIYICDS